MNNSTILNITRFIILVLLQVTILCNINFLGYINPYLYVWFIILLPIKTAQWKVLLFSFLIGVTIDIFQDSGGVNAAASLVIAYLRPVILRFSFGLSYEYQTVRFQKTPFKHRFTYMTIMVLIHHFVLFLLEVFNLSDLIFILKKTLFSSIFTILLLILLTALFQKRTR